MRFFIKPIFSILLLATVSASSWGQGFGAPIQPDPYQSFNRAIFGFNTGFNDYIARPVVKVYTTVVPSVVRTGVHNFFDNLGTIPAMGNDLLQGNVSFFFHDLGRFLINSTLGCLGLFDLAKDAHLYHHEQSFGLTMAKWGYHNTNYIVWPFLGPSNVRGTIGMVPDYFMSPLSYYHHTPWKFFAVSDWRYYAALGLYTLQMASELLPTELMLTKTALDPYAAVRSAYMQNLNYRVQQVEQEKMVPDLDHQDKK